MNSKGNAKISILIRLFFGAVIVTPIIVALSIGYRALTTVSVQEGDPTFPPLRAPTITGSACDSMAGHTLKPPVIKPLSWHGTGLVTLWFDDAWISQYNSGEVQAMNKYGYVGALSVPTGYICTPGFMTWNQVRELQSEGWEITSHSVSHIFDYNKYDHDTTVYELSYSRSELISRGFNANIFVMPYGYKPDLVPQVVNYAKQIYAGYRRAGDQVNPIPVVEPYNILSHTATDQTTEDDVKGWLDEAAKTHSWLIITFHNIDDRKVRYDIDLDMFNKVLDLIHASNLPVVLPSQVLNIKSADMSGIAPTSPLNTPSIKASPVSNPLQSEKVS